MNRGAPREACDVRLGGVARSSSTAQPAEKTCASCGRRIEWRKKWERDWERVKYCSAGCRRHGIDDTDRMLEESILRLLAARAAGRTICPSEAARAVAHDAARKTRRQSTEPLEQTPWKDLMEPARRAARRLVASGQVEITQGGKVVDPSTARGPIRIRRV